MIEREKLQHLIENIGIPKLCLILLLGISLIIVSIPSGKTKKNAQSTETTAKEDSICEKAGETIGQCIKTCRRSRKSKSDDHR